MERLSIEVGKLSLMALAAATLVLGAVYYLGEQTLEAGEHAVRALVRPTH